MCNRVLGETTSRKMPNSHVCQVSIAMNDLSLIRTTDILSQIHRLCQHRARTLWNFFTIMVFAFGMLPMNAQSFTDREKQGLRGPVRECTQIDVYEPPQQDSSTDTSRQTQAKTTMVFDPEGHLHSMSHTNPDGTEWETHFNYNESGTLVSTTSGPKGGPQTKVINEYDVSGRILKTMSSARDVPVATYTYDEQGRKQKTQTSSASDYKERLAYGGTPFSAADHAPNLPGGGTTTTVYDDLDRPFEIEVRDDTGEVVSRAIRIFNAKGQVIEDKQILSDPTLIFPRKTLQQIVNQAGISPDDLRAELLKLMNGNSGPFGEKHEYDAQGRIVKTYRHIFNREEIVETSYNEHGDPMREITRLVLAAEGSPPEPAFNEVNFQYQYDGNGNWTEKTVLYRTDPDEDLKESSTMRRYLKYF